MSIALRNAAAIALLVVAAACGGSGQPDRLTEGPIWEEGEWSVGQVLVVDSTVPNPSTFAVGDRVTFEFERIVAERRGALARDLSRESIEKELGFPLDEYENTGSDLPQLVELRYAADRLQHAEQMRFTRTLTIRPGDWAMPPTLTETWRRERPGDPDEAWQVAFSFARR